MSSPASSPSTTTTEGVTKRRVASLLARRRQNLDRDGHIESERYDFQRDADRHKIRRVVVKNKETGDKTIDHDLTALEGAAPSTTSRLEVLQMEARQAAEADAEEIEHMNPHIPSNDDVLETATEAIESEGLVPAWEVCDR